MCRKRRRSGFCVPAGEGTSLWAEVGGSAGKALQGDVEEVSPHILHSLLLLLIFLAAFLPVRLQLVSTSPPPPQVTSPANQTLLHTFIFHCSPPPQPLLPPPFCFPLPSFLPLPHASPRVSPRFLLPSFLSLFFCFSLITGESVNCSLMKRLWCLRYDGKYFVWRLA